MGEVSAEFECLSLFFPDLSNQKQETVTFSSQVAILFGVFHCRAIFSLPKKTFQDLLKKKKLKKNFVKAIASLSCLSGAVLSHFWYVYQNNYINLTSLMGFTKPIRHYAESTHVKKKMIQSHFKKS